MKIITKGDVRKARKVIRFECKRCGCVFEADSTEFDKEFIASNEWYYHCKCPTCKKGVRSDAD